MSKKKNQAYNSMCDEGYDNKVPLHSDEAFQLGIQFKIKLVGSLEVSKPTSRTEIVAAMRRIRYEFKARSIKKRAVNLSISVEGLQVSLWKKSKRYSPVSPTQTVLMQYPVHRVFYVSHDSQDLKIFSFIARDNNTNTFRCHVFKAYKKNEAIHVVRTIGQAFEVCHKLSQEQPPNLNPPLKEHKVLPSIPKSDRYSQSVQIPTPSINVETNDGNYLQSPLASELTLKHQMQFMQEQLQQMHNESELAFQQIKLVKEQLNLEITARIDSQNKNKQLIERNRELLKHIQQLLLYTHELETKLNNNNNQNFPLMKPLPSRPADLLLLPSLFTAITTSASTSATSNRQHFSSGSPDSGKGKEISSDNSSEAFLPTIPDHAITHSWKKNCISASDDFTTRSISINETISKDTNLHYEDYSSTSSTCSSMKTTSQNLIEHYLYDRIIPSTSYTKSTLTQSSAHQKN